MMHEAIIRMSAAQRQAFLHPHREQIIDRDVIAAYTHDMRAGWSYILTVHDKGPEMRDKDPVWYCIVRRRLEDGWYKPTEDWSPREDQRAGKIMRSAFERVGTGEVDLRMCKHEIHYWRLLSETEKGLLPEERVEA